MALDFKAVVEALTASWDASSSSLPHEWSKGNPARGQCAVSSLVVQDYFGGDILRFVVEFDGTSEKHFVNLIDGALVDTTFSQFPDNPVTKVNKPDLKGHKDLRTKLLADDDTSRRYHHLKGRVGLQLSK